MQAITSEGGTFAIFDYLSDPVVVTDARFDERGPEVVYANDTFADLCGRTKADVVGQGLSALHPGLRDSEKLADLERCCRDRCTYRNKGPLATAHGLLASMTWHIAPVFEGAGLEHLLCFVDVNRDREISDLEAAVAELRESESQLTAILDHSPAEIYLKDAKGRYVKINREFERMFNVRDQDLRGKLPHDAHYPDLADRTRAHDLQVLRTGEVVVREEEAYLEDPADDSPHILHTIKFPIFDDGRVAGLGAIVTDITETRRAEQALRESERRLRDFAEIAADWFWETDEELRITYISDVHRYITGIPDAQIIGRTREELFRNNIYCARDPEIHLRTLNNYWESMVEYSVVRGDGQEVVVHDRASPFFDIEGNFKGYRGVGKNITEQKRLNEHIAWQASRDPLTGILNRREFERHLEEAIAGARDRGEHHVLCFTDLNRFKLLNDTLGHAAGDYSLKTVVSKIQAHVAAGDVLGRIGGDEFGILMKHTDMARAERFARRIGRSIRTHEFNWQGREFTVALSAGLAPVDRHTRSTSEVMARADSACYRAKAAGRQGIWVSDEVEAARMRAYSEILNTLSRGPADLSENFRLVGQPICSLSDELSRPAWYEVLLRLVGDDGRYYRPYDFIRLAEQHGKMPLIDQWVLEQALVAHARLVERVPHAVLSINVAENSLTTDRLQVLMDGMMNESRIRPANLCFEFSEATVMIDLKETVSLASWLSKRGFKIALDEFGSGLSSFECLRNVPAHYVKICGAFVRELSYEGPDRAIVESMQDLSHRLGLTPVAVQVETNQAIDVLKRIGIEYGQGDALATIRSLDELISDLMGAGA